MSSFTRREFMKIGSAVALGAIVIDKLPNITLGDYPEKIDLRAGWLLQSSALADQGGGEVSAPAYKSDGW